MTTESHLAWLVGNVRRVATMSKATKLDKGKAREFFTSGRATDFACEYGHLGCSNSRDGACDNELAALWPQYGELD